MPIVDKLIAVIGFVRDPKSDSAETEYNASLEGMGERVKTLGALAAKTAGLVTALGGTFAVLAKGSAESTDQLYKFTQAKGLAFADVQSLIYAGELYGSTSDEIVNAIGNVQDKIADFKRGEGDFRLLGELGVSVQGKDALQFIESLADNFKNFSQERAQNLGKKLGLDDNFIELLRSGSASIAELQKEFVDLGGTLDDQAGVNAANYIDSLHRLNTVIGSIRNRVMLGVVPAIVRITDKVADFIKGNRKLIEQGLEIFIGTVLYLLERLGDALLFVVDLWLQFTELMGGVRNAVVALSIAFIAYKVAAIGTIALIIARVAILSGVITALNAKVLFIPLLIAAGVAAALLVLQDLFIYLNGGESLIGDIVKGFSNWRGELGKMKPVIDALMIPFETLIKVGEAIGNISGYIGSGDASDAIKALGGSLTNTQNIGGFTGVSPLREGFATRNINSTGTLSIEAKIIGNGNPEEAARGIIKGGLEYGESRGLTVISPGTL